MDKQVYNRIKAVLAEKGKTNNWLADELDMNRTTVSKWCRNDMQPRVETLFQIANALEIDVKIINFYRKTLIKYGLKKDLR